MRNGVRAMNTTSEQEATCTTAGLAVREPRSPHQRRHRRGAALEPRDQSDLGAVEDDRAGESFQLEVDAADALAAFHHPYAYATTAARPAFAE
jgi:hypothetical protein